MAGAVGGALPTIDEIGDLCEAGAQPTDRVGGNYVAAELPATRLHVTLIPPSGRREADAHGAADDGSPHERSLAMRRLNAAVGTWVRVTLHRYHVARWGDGGRRLAFWEVDVDGLAEHLHYPPQRQVRLPTIIQAATPRLAFSNVELRRFTT